MGLHGGTVFGSLTERGQRVKWLRVINITQMRHLPASVVVVLLLAGGLAARSTQTTTFFPLDDLRPGMTGTGRTVFAGDTIEDFKVQILGVLRNVMGPKRDLVLARLEGGPLATTGVMQGMSGSPVYIDGRLLGAVSYSLGSFPREPLAGITPIGEMIDAVNSSGPRTDPGISVPPTATPAEAYAALSRIATEVVSPL